MPVKNIIIAIHLKVPYQLTWLQELYSYLGRTTRILRENSEIFTRGKQVIFLPTATYSVCVNGWYAENKTIYTIYSTLAGGYNGLLFEVERETGFHFVDLWNNVELQPKRVGGKYRIKTAISPVDASWPGTDNEGENGCIARFPSLIDIKGYPRMTETPAVHDPTGIVPPWMVQVPAGEFTSRTEQIGEWGSYFTPLSSWWYVKGGPLPLINRQQQYRVSPGYERAATIGLRCVM